jgi:hypothetical protein
MAGPREVPELEVWKLEMSMVGPQGVLAVGPAAATTEVGDVDGGPTGGLLAACPVAAITEIGDVYGGPPRGCWRHVRQRPPLKLETSMAGHLGGSGGMSSSGHHRS